MATFRVTAGHYHSLAAAILCEGLVRGEHTVEAIHVVSPWQIQRLRRLLHQRGPGWLVRRAIGRRTDESPSALDPLATELGVETRSLRRWAREHGVELSVCKSLNEESVIRALRQGSHDAVIYGGGGILKGEFLDAARRTLNAHAGPLPQVRGMNAAEWALLLGEPPEVTIHLIDRGIDTGPVLRRARYSRDDLRTVEQLRDRAVATGLTALLDVVGDGSWADTGEPPAGGQSRQCFVMAPALVQVVARRLES